MSCVRGQLDEILQVFQRCILELQQHEPPFWQLRIAEYIHHVVKAQVVAQMLKRGRASDENELFQNENDDANAAQTARVRGADCEVIESLAIREHQMLTVKAKISQSIEFASASEQIYRAVQDELLRLFSLLSNIAETTFTENHCGSARKCPDFLQLFWKELQRTTREHDEHSRYNQRGGDTMDDTMSCSFEAISFADLADDCGSANRYAPCLRWRLDTTLCINIQFLFVVAVVVRLSKTSRPSQIVCGNEIQISESLRWMISWRCVV